MKPSIDPRPILLGDEGLLDGVGGAPRAAPGPALDPRDSALIELMEDESPAVWAAVRDQLLAGGPRFHGALRHAVQGDRPRSRHRARQVLLQLDRAAVMRRLARRACRKKVDLESSLFLLSNLDRPHFDARPYRKTLDAMAAAVLELCAKESTEIGRAMALVRYLGDERGFEGSERDYHHPDNIFLHRAIERRRGIPLTLCAIYLAVARRAGIRATVVPLPGHVLLRLHGGRRTLLVDPFQGGKICSRKACTEYLVKHGLTPRSDWFRDAEDTALFQRQLLNLMHSWQRRGLNREARGLYRIAQIIAGARRVSAVRPASGHS